MTAALESSPSRSAARLGTVSPAEPAGTDADLWEAVGRGDVAASAELYHRYGAVAYAVARAVTGDDERAEQAVIAAFAELRHRPAGPGSPGRRSLRVEVLDASRRSARRLAPRRRERRRWRGRQRTQDAYRSMSPDVRDVLALAVAGRCGGGEIATIMGVDPATIWTDLRVGLRHAGAVLDVRPPSGAPHVSDVTLGRGR